MFSDFMFYVSFFTWKIVKSVILIPLYFFTMFVEAVLLDHPIEAEFFSNPTFWTFIFSLLAAELSMICYGFPDLKGDRAFSAAIEFFVILSLALLSVWWFFGYGIASSVLIVMWLGVLVALIIRIFQLALD